jgi:hypothetical protein
MLHLIKMWLEAPVEETDDRGRKQRTTRNKDQGRGTPQGAPVSPFPLVPARWLKLAVNETKTHVCQVPQETFDFLGYTFGTCCSPKTGRAYIGTKPAKKRVARVCATIGEITDRKQTFRDPAEVVMQLNRTIGGWANYFCLGPVSKAYHAVERHTRNRLRQWLAKKHKMTGRATSRFPDAYLHQTLGLIELSPRTASFPWAGT